MRTDDQTIAAFYDVLAADYDAMTDMEKRFVRERPFFHLIIGRHHIATAIDAGCGTGFHSLLLAQLGVAVTAIDVSDSMLDRLRRHARTRGLDIAVHNSSFQNLSTNGTGRVDALFSMGNSLAHLLTADDLDCALQNFVKAVKPGGTLILQLLNYDRILAQRARVQNERVSGNLTFRRTYEYNGELLTFAIEKWDASTLVSTQTITLRPIQSAAIVDALERAGVQAINLFGSITLDKYDQYSSQDIVVIGKTL